MSLYRRKKIPIHSTELRVIIRPPNQLIKGVTYLLGRGARDRFKPEPPSMNA
jgi:hypothetical protein